MLRNVGSAQLGARLAVAQGSDIVPIPGTSGSSAWMKLAALDIRLSKVRRQGFRAAPAVRPARATRRCDEARVLRTTSSDRKLSRLEARRLKVV